MNMSPPEKAGTMQYGPVMSQSGTLATTLAASVAADGLAETLGLVEPAGVNVGLGDELGDGLPPRAG